METGVYTITNKVNGKMYVGSTTRTFEKRKGEHFDDLIKGDHHSNRLQRSFNKYGIENFVFEILDECLPEFCYSTEQFWLNMLDLNNPKRGYNIRPRVDSAYGFRLSEEGRKKHSEALKGKMLSGDKHHQFGKPMSDYTRQRIAEGQLKFKTLPDYPERIRKITEVMRNSNLVPVLQFSEEGKLLNRFNSIKEAGEATGANPKIISMICSGNPKSKTAGGFRWAYADSGLTELANFVKNERLTPVIQLTKNDEFVKEWVSLAAAAKGLGLKSPTAIFNSCRNSQKTSAGFKWRYK